jgi:hypothetical protein
MNASTIGNHVCGRCRIIASCTNIVLVVSKHDDLVLGALADKSHSCAMATSSSVSGRALAYRRQSMVTNTHNTKSDSSVKLSSLTVLTPTIRSFPEASSYAKFSILKHPTPLLPDLVLHVERASTNPATTNQSSVFPPPAHRFTVVESHEPLTRSSEPEAG